MNSRIAVIVGIVLIAAGVAALVYGGFTYTQESHDVDLGFAKVELAEKERVNIPVWAGVGAVAVGTVVLVFGRRRR